VRNHARGAVACDFFVVITATFRSLYVFVILEIGTRRILHWNDCPSDGGMDSAAVPNGNVERFEPSIRHS
jgi:hypothetical protein